MKYSFLLVASLCVAALCRAQDYKVTADNSKDARLVLDGFPEDLSIEGYAGTEIIVTGGKHENSENSDRAKGLKPIYAAGTDNTGVGLSMEKDGSRFLLRCLLHITQDGH